MEGEEFWPESFHYELWTLSSCYAHSIILLFLTDCGAGGMGAAFTEYMTIKSF
jgi:hypothetical protein